MKHGAEWLWIGIGLCPLTLSAQLPDRDQRVQTIAGCYTLTHSAWSSPIFETGLPSAFTLPARFRLDTAHVERRRGPGHVVEPDQLTASSLTRTAWIPLSDNMVRVVWSTGFVGVALLMQVRGDTLVGTATPFWDAHIDGEPPPPTAKVSAVRASCTR